jgi:predicted nucleic acid-binding protein
VIYLDTSVVLAQLLAEDRRPDPALWRNPLATSRLLEYEVWTALHRLRLARSHGEAARAILARLAFVELRPESLSRALDPFPKAVRTLDALHLASADFLRRLGQDVEIASYDERRVAAARALKFKITSL